VDAELKFKSLNKCTEMKGISMHVCIRYATKERICCWLQVIKFIKGMGMNCGKYPNIAKGNIYRMNTAQAATLTYM